MTEPEKKTPDAAEPTKKDPNVELTDLSPTDLESVAGGFLDTTVKTCRSAPTAGPQASSGASAVVI